MTGDATLPGSQAEKCRLHAAVERKLQALENKGYEGCFSGWPGVPGCAHCLSRDGALLRVCKA